MPDLNPQQFKWWHGSAYGGPSETPGETGVHVGTQHAAREALNAMIGHRADGADWDGSTEYGKTLLAGKNTLKKLGQYASGYSMHAPEEDHYPSGTIGSGRQVPLDTKPALFPVKITGEMTNAEHSPHEDFRANGLMKGQLKRGTARRGYYYSNRAEDVGSVSAVVPGWSHLKDLR